MNKQRFEIPIEPEECNLFAIDDYLRSIQSSAERQKLIRTVGISAETREKYEREHGLPRGAVELAVMAEDKRIAVLNDVLVKKLCALQNSEATQDAVKEMYMEIGSKAAGIRALYPEAMHFLMQYSAMTRRTAAAFRGDYRFGNEFKIIQVQCAPSPNAQANSSSPVNVNVWVNVNLGIFINAGVAINVVAAFKYALAVVLWIWAAAFVIP
ncbi:MAG: hypothetical protein WCS94_11835 [Verrucomicrobiota bacterium]